MATIEKEFNWKEGNAKVWFDIETNIVKTTATNIRIEKSSSDINLPEFPIIVENAQGEEVFRSDRMNQEEGHTFYYFDNKFSREIIAFINQTVTDQTPRFG